MTSRKFRPITYQPLPSNGPLMSDEVVVHSHLSEPTPLFRPALQSPHDIHPQPFTSSLARIAVIALVIMIVAAIVIVYR
jgi:hypothetical protein